MDREYKRRHKEYVELTKDNLLSGEIPNPFTPRETEIIIHFRDGFDGQRSNLPQLGISEMNFRRIRSEIGAKVREIYKSSGQDIMAKAISLSILSGWIEGKTTDNDVSLGGEELRVVFHRAFGFTPGQIRKRLIWSEEKYEETFGQIKQKLGFDTEYEVVAWGATKAKQWLSENPNAEIPFLPE